MHRTAKYLYIIGGCALAAEREPINKIERIHVESVGKALDSPPRVKIISNFCGELAVPRRSPSCFLIKNRPEFLIAGGCTGPNEHTDSMELFTVFEENGTGKSELLEEKLMIGASCSAFDVLSSSTYKPIIGGFEAHNCLNDVQVVDTATWKCRRLTKQLPKIKNSTVVEVKDGEFLMFGGWQDEQMTTKTFKRLTFNEDYTDFTVEFAGFLTYEVEGHSCVRIGSSVLLIGGFDGCFVLDTIIRYDLESKEMEVLPTKLCQKRENHVSAVLSDKYLVVAAGWSSRQALDDVEVFEIDTSDGLKLTKCQVEGKLEIARNRPAGVPV